MKRHSNSKWFASRKVCACEHVSVYVYIPYTYTARSTQETLVKVPNWIILSTVNSYWLKAIEYHSQTGSVSLTVYFLYFKISGSSRHKHILNLEQR